MPFITAREDAGLSRSGALDGVDGVVLAGQRIAVDWVLANGAADGLATIRLAGDYTCPMTRQVIKVGQERIINPLRFEIADTAWIRSPSPSPPPPPRSVPEPGDPQSFPPLRGEADKARFLHDGLVRLGYSPAPFSDLDSQACRTVVLRFQQDERLPDVDGIAGPDTFGALSERLLPDSRRPDDTDRFSVERVAKLFPDAPLENIRTHLPHVLEALRKLKLGDQEMILMALATIRAETAGFEPIDEFQSQYNTRPGGAPFGEYDHILGNQGPPDGARYKGRGFIQLTGRSNYQEIGRELAVDLVGRPELANDPATAAAILATFLHRRKRRIRGCLLLSDLAGARRTVNGGTHGLEAFRTAYLTGLQLTGDGPAATQAEADHPAPRESVRAPFDPSAPIDWKNPKCKVSRYFTVGEVTQGDPRRIPAKGSTVEANILRLAAELDKVREAWGTPIGVTSWYRPPAVNQEVGGVANSQHIPGLAADIYTMDAPDQWHPRNREFEHWLDTTGWANRALGYGCASNRGFTHVDLRPGRIRWNY
jgi:peptidoglycan L-alanyl-D-glutamate endopeptidase CwlK